MPSLIRRAAAVLALAVAGMAIGPAALAAEPVSAVAQPDEVWFGPDLDWTEDAPDGYVDRLGAIPSLYELTLPYPIDDNAAAQWRTSARAVATQGAVLVLSLLPSKDLEDLTDADAVAAEDLLAEVHDQYGTQQLVRFAPEMNGTWISWGQQPTAFIDAFSRVADTIHDGDSGALTVWAPSYGSGYPFGLAEGRLDSISTTDLAKLDTDGDDEIGRASCRERV